jgi:hypothetical protein
LRRQCIQGALQCRTIIRRAIADGSEVGKIESLLISVNVITPGLEGPVVRSAAASLQREEVQPGNDEDN